MELLRDDFDFDYKLKHEPYTEDAYDLIYPLEWDLLDPALIQNPRKYVTGIRSHALWSARRDYFSFIHTVTHHYAAVHAVSRKLTELLTPHIPHLQEVSHGVDLRQFSPQTRADLSGAGKLRLGWAGTRNTPEKGFEEFVRPLARIPGVELVVCGPGGNLRHSRDMAAFYDSIDAYICASLTEGNCNPVMEAAAMARAIITTDSGTVTEYLRHGHSALIVPRELPALIAAVCRLRDHPAERVTLGAAAQAAVGTHFDWRDIAGDYRRFFLHALALSAAGRAPASAPATQVLDLLAAHATPNPIPPPPDIIAEKNALIANYHRMSRDPVISTYRKLRRTLGLWKY